MSRDKLFFIILAVIISGTLYHGTRYYYKHQQKELKEKQYEELHSIAQLKANQLTQWYNERLSEVNYFSSNNPYRGYILEIIEGNRDSEEELRQSLVQIMTNQRYNNIFVIDDKDDLLFSIDPGFELIDTLTVSYCRMVFESGGIVIPDFYYCKSHNEIHYEAIAPVFDQDKNVAAAMVFRVDPNDFLFPFMQDWPTPSESAETYIVRAQGDSVIYLNNLRHTDNSVLRIVFPLDRTEITAVKAALGYEGIVEGIDYNGEKVLADIRKVEGTSWYIISEIYTKEIYADLKRHAVLLDLITLLLILFTGLAVAWVYHLRQNSIYKELLQKKTELYQSQEEYGAILYSIGDGVITTDEKGIITNLNPVAEKLTGWKEAEAKGRYIEEVFKIVSEETKEKVASPVTKVLKEGRIVGLANHTILISKDRREIPINDSGAPVRGMDNQILGAVMVFSDQTEERLRNKLIDIRLKLFEYAIDHTLEETLTRMLNEIGDLFQSPLGYFHILMPDNETIWLKAWSTATKEELCKINVQETHYKIREAGFWADCVKSKKPLIYNDYGLLSQRKDLPEGHPAVARIITVPVIRDEKVVATLGIANKPVDYTGTDLEIVSFLADVTWEIAEHKLNETRLRQSEERFYHLFERAPLGYQSLDEDGNIIEVNEAWTETFGLSREEVTGKYFVDLLQPEDELHFINVFNKSKETGRFNTELRMIHNDGVSRIITIEGRIGFKDNGSFEKAHCIIQDITDKKQMEIKIRESEEKMSSIFRIAPTGIGVVADRIIKEVNPQFCKMVGYSKEELIGKNSMLLYPSHEEFEYVGTEKYDQIAKTGSGTVETQWIKKDGTIIDIILSSTIIDKNDLSKGLIFTALDITERKRSELKIKEHERQLASMVGSLSGFVYRCKYDKDWTMLYLSKKFEDITGYKTEDLLHNNKFSFNDIIKEEYREEILRKWDKVIKQRTNFNHDYQLITASGEIKWVQEQGVGVYDDRGNVLFLEGYVEDISERKKTEKQLVESEDKFRRLFYEHAAGQFIIDPDDGSIVDVNRSASESFGWGIDELKRMDVSQLLVISGEETEQKIKEALTLKNTQFELKLKKANGKIVDVDVFSSTVNIAGKEYIHAIVHDITEKKRAENALMESEEQNRLLMVNSMDAILLTKPDGSIINVNDAACKMFGMTKNEIYAAGRDGLADTGDPSLKMLLETRNRYGFAKGELTFIRKNGNKFPTEITSSLFKNKSGEVFTSMIIRDITERRNWETELMSAMKKAEESDRLKSAFLANISHEIRTPMNGILGFLELLKEPDLNDSDKNIYIDIVNQSGKRLLDTINDIIEISKIEAGVSELKLEKVNVEDIMEYHYHFFMPQSKEKGVQLIIDKQIKGNESKVITDKYKLDCILSNLIKNAIKFTSKGFVKIGNFIEGNNLVFYVEDTGRGISPDRVNAVFERFTQAEMGYNRPHDGSGLGLSIVKAFVDIMGGSIEVRSEVGEGSVFTFSIPYNISESQSRKEVTKAKSDKQLPSGLTILIAEDDVVCYKLLEVILSSKGIRLIHTVNGFDTVDTIRNNPDISIILMDMKMPGLSGLDATRRIREFNKEVIIIAQTALAMSGDKEKIVEAGCNDYISKPVKRDDLLNVIEKYI